MVGVIDPSFDHSKVFRSRDGTRELRYGTIPTHGGYGSENIDTHGPI